MFRTRVKICGITSAEDARAAVDAGADAIGLVFYAPSARAVSIEKAAEICDAVPAFVTVTGLFVDHDANFVENALSSVALDLLQFHGNETEAFCSGFTLPYIKAIRVRSAEDVMLAEQSFASSRGLLVDTYKKGVAGGTGETFDWGLLPAKHNKPLVLAGGLNVQNVRSAIDQVKPYAVDVSGGVEKSKGVKDHAQLKLFIEEVYRGG